MTRSATFERVSDLSTSDRSKPLRVGCIVAHPAPYHSDTFATIHRRGRVDIEVLYLYPDTSWHPYWLLAEAPTFPSRILETPRCKYPSSHDWPGVIDLLRQRSYDVVFLSGYRQRTLRRALLYCIFHKCPFVFVADSILSPSSFLKRAAKATLKRAAKATVIWVLRRFAGAVWVPGAASREYWSHYGFPDYRIFEGAYCIGSDAVERATLDAQSQRESMRAKLRIPKTQYVFLFVGRFIQQRGLHCLLTAFSRLTRAVPDVGLLLVGGGPLRHEIEQSVAELGLGNVIIHDPVAFESLPLFYAAADAYVQPSSSEPYSLSSAQAAYSGLPLIVTDAVGAGRDFVVSGLTGFVVPTDDSEALSNAMQWLAANPSSGTAMGDLLREKAIVRTTLWAASQFEAAVTMAAQFNPERFRPQRNS